MAPEKEDYDESIMKQAIGAGRIEDGTGDFPRTYNGTVPFDIGTDVYMIDQETFHKFVKDGLRLLSDNRVPISPQIVQMMPDELHFATEGGSNEPKLTKLFLDRYFYTHDLMSYVYVRYASMNQFFEEEELANYESHRHTPRIDPIEDNAVIRDDVRKAKGLEGKIKEECGDKGVKG